ncbi:MAG: helix-turn-helix transcriptional regulator [Acidaminococcus provencensis]|nr:MULTISPECIES: helix-turn-helix domain-containing protein [Acidaminococcus]MCH4096222.1 helix-turn-helix transcriptional regulator [Acidaminococcus provencensis]
MVAQRLLQGKWAIAILYLLSTGPVRFNELQRKLQKINHATLSTQLKQLETEGLIVRKEYAQIPPKVEYSLTPIGREFQPVLDSIGVWAQKYVAAQKS